MFDRGGSARSRTSPVAVLFSESLYFLSRVTKSRLLFCLFEIVEESLYFLGLFDRGLLRALVPLHGTGRPPRRDFHRRTRPHRRGLLPLEPFSFFLPFEPLVCLHWSHVFLPCEPLDSHRRPRPYRRGILPLEPFV